MKRLLITLVVLAAMPTLACYILNPTEAVEVTIRDAAGPRVLNGWTSYVLFVKGRGEELADFRPDSLPFTFRESVEPDDCHRLALQVWSIGLGLGYHGHLQAALDLDACGVFLVESDEGEWTVIRQGNLTRQ